MMCRGGLGDGVVGYYIVVVYFKINYTGPREYNKRRKDTKEDRRDVSQPHSSMLGVKLAMWWL